MHHKNPQYRQKRRSVVLAVLSVFIFVQLVPTVHAESTFSSTMLINRESFWKIDSGDSTTDIRVDFGDTGSGLLLNITDDQFEFDADLEVQGTMSGRIIHAQDSFTSSGNLMIKGTSTLSGAVTINDEATFGSGIIINDVTYIFPFGDASASGRILASDGNGNLSWTAAGSTPNVFQTISVSGQSNVVSDAEADTLTFAQGAGITLTTSAGSDEVFVGLSAAHSGTTITAVTLLSGALVHAQNNLTSSGGLSVDGPARFDSTVDVLGILSGETIRAQDYLSSSGSLAVEGTTRFQSATDATDFFQIGDTDGGTSIFNVDTTNERVGIGVDAPTYTLEVAGSAGLDDFLYHNDDADTFLSFTDDKIDINIGGVEFFDFVEDGSQDILTFNNGAADVDFQIQGDSDANTLYVEGSSDRVGIGLAAPDTKLEIAGTASGRIMHGQDSVTSSGTLVWEGAASGASLYVADGFAGSGLTDCDTAGTDKLLWDATTERFSCGTDTDTDTQLSQEQVEDFVDGVMTAGSGITLTYDDSNGTFTVAQGFSSGSIVALSPEYSGAVYYGDGGTNVGQLVLEYDSTNKENYYKWTSTKTDLNDYNISIRVQVPDEFDHWDGTVPIQFRYRTNAASTDDNQIDVTMLDTAGSSVSLTDGANLANTSWTTATVTGPESAGTYTPGGYITIILAMQARTTNTGEAHAGFININWHTEAD